MSGEGFIPAAPSCATCGVGSWHPEVRNCTLADCSFRAWKARDASAEGPSLFPSALTAPAAVLFPVHDASVADAGARNHA